MISINTIDTPGVHSHASPLEHAAQREDVADVVVHHEHGLADEILVRAVQALEHLLLLGWQIRKDAVQEQRCFVEQPLG